MAETKPSRSFRSFIWDTDTHLKSPEERKLLRKLDWSILTIGCLGFFMKYLDQGNLTNAYVSGMQEDLAMYGNEYTYAQTAYTCAYAVMQIPSTLIVQKIRPSVWLAAMELIDLYYPTGVFTFAQAGLRTHGELYAFRFLVGFFESSFFPVLLYVLGSWYTKTELAKRVAIFHMTAPLGSAFGGYLQAAVYQNLNGAHGLAGWRWLYIVCGCMTVPIGLATFFILPDTPYTTRSRFLTPAECQMAIDRVTKAGKAAPAGVTLQTFKRVLTKWRCIWLKSENFSVVDRNVIPTGSKLISAAYTWANEICAGDNEERALVISSMNGMQYAVDAWLPIVIFPQTMAPTFRRGFPATWGFVIAAIFAVILIRFLVFREQRRLKANGTSTEVMAIEVTNERGCTGGDLTKHNDFKNNTLTV
ncbi:putative pantothenate transporter liz1 protein [Eutypa lata UCREL1]|uniref:Putative pantothenate transporter liz1 protein n=1 Tax=Eutypa lata (strain UCR-EL1) TaxID=1287681 RepID=M7T8X7_EUTLA|nr:putative pantothenate transporter liz1 protein [Eutypa lata UCREL1]